MRVGVYIANLSPDSGGGYTYLTELISILQEKNEKHEFVSVGLSHAPANGRRKHIHIELPEGISSSPENSEVPISQGSETDRKICAQLSAAGVDVIWYPDPFSLLTLEYPYFLTVWDLEHRHKPYFPEINQNGGWLWREQHFLMAVQRAARVFTATQAGREELIHFYRLSERNIAFLPMIMPRPPERFSEEKVLHTLEKLSLSPGFLFYPAQFWPHKNHVTLLRALRLVCDQSGHSLHLVFTGSDKGNQDHIRELAAQLGLEKQVHFLGFVSREELFCLYQGALALTYVSFFGPDNLPPLEAFASQCPVISSTLSGAPEQLGDAALLVNPEKPEEIAAAIKKLLDHPELRTELKARGLAKMENHSPDKIRRCLSEALDSFEPHRRSWPSQFLKEKAATPAPVDLSTGVLSIQHDLKLKDEEISRLKNECTVRDASVSALTRDCEEKDQALSTMAGDCKTKDSRIDSLSKECELRLQVLKENADAADRRMETIKKLQRHNKNILILFAGTVVIAILLLVMSWFG